MKIKLAEIYSFSNGVVYEKHYERLKDEVYIMLRTRIFNGQKFDGGIDRLHLVVYTRIRSNREW